MKLAIREGMVPGRTLPERLTWIERAGLQGIELHGDALGLPADDLRAIFAVSPVQLASIDGGVGLLDADPAVRAAARDRIAARLALAGELGAAGVLVVPQFGRVPALPDLAPVSSGADLERALLLAALRDLAPVAHASGARLFLEPLNRYEAYLVNRVAQGATLAAEIGPEVGTMADFFHMNIEEADIPDAIRVGGERIVHVHLADSNRLQPGRGHLDFASGFAALKEIGYDGWFGIECRLEGDPLEAVRESAARMRGLWAVA
ncbi:MAG: sugar phosphate isomerase/epimerase [Thermomicrobiales bacterium]|nr:sugar phosphate isomerase/epimerase [Thermomicrobiales bacterium]